MGFGAGDHVFDVGIAPGAEALAGARAVDPAESFDDVELDALRVPVFDAVVGEAAVLGRDGEAAPARRGCACRACASGAAVGTAAAWPASHGRAA